MAAYYNEIDHYAAEWLRELIKAGHLPDGEVDERSIEDVKPDDLVGFAQCHFFAGIGGWPLALRHAGWPDNRPVWTGSCPCQPFSAAGQGAGFDDERHLWPAFCWLISQQQPEFVFGEQVASKAADLWFDLVQADLEGMGYAFGCVAFPSASVGAPHIRDRAFWVGHRDIEGSQGHAGNDSKARRKGAIGPVATTDVSGGMANADSGQCESGWHGEPGDGRNSSRLQSDRFFEACQFCGYEFDVENLGIYGCPNCEGDGLGDAIGIERSDGTGRESDHQETSKRRKNSSTDPGSGSSDRSDPLDGIWSGSDWLFCQDGKFRPVESGTFPLADGVSDGLGRVQSRLLELGVDAKEVDRLTKRRGAFATAANANRVGRLKGYGNAINPIAGKVFIECFLESL